MPNEINPWRRTFIALADELCRRHDVPTPPLFEAFDKSLIVTIGFEGIEFDVIHADPCDQVGRLLVQCRIAQMQDPFDGDATGQALNLDPPWTPCMTNRCSPDGRTRELVHMLHLHLDHTTAADLTEMMGTATDAAHAWQHAHLGDGSV